MTAPTGHRWLVGTRSGSRAVKAWPEGIEWSAPLRRAYIEAMQAHLSRLRPEDSVELNAWRTGRWRGALEVLAAVTGWTEPGLAQLIEEHAQREGWDR